MQPSGYISIASLIQTLSSHVEDSPLQSREGYAEYIMYFSLGRGPNIFSRGSTQQATLPGIIVRFYLGLCPWPAGVSSNYIYAIK